MINSAYHYLDNGLNPIPTKKDKSPLLPAGHPYLYEKIDNIEKYFSGAEMISIAAGRVSDGIECIDFDENKDAPGTPEGIAPIFETYINDTEVQYLLKQGKISVNKTQGGGFHVIIKSEYSNRSTVLARYLAGGAMIEVRGEGSYFVVPPSQRYSHIAGPEMVKLDLCEKEERQYLIDFARSFTLVAQANGYNNNVKKSWPEHWDNEKPFGRFNNNGWPYAERELLAAGWAKGGARSPHSENTVQYWTRPGKVKGVSATFGHKNNMFYVFSGNAAPFEDHTAYTPSDVMIKLKFAGNQTAFKDWVIELYQLRPVIVQQPGPVKFEFPLHVFNDAVGTFLKVCNNANDYNKDFLAVAALYSFATLCGNSFKLRVKNGWVAPSIFWFVAVGETGTMKTHPLKYITKPLSSIDMKQKHQYDIEMEEWHANEKKGKKPNFKQIQVNDYTLEALHDVCMYNKRGIGLFRDEIVGFLKDMNKYRKGSDEEFWLESYNNGNYIVNRVTKDVMAIENVCINILGSIQPEVLSGIAKEREGNGLIERFLFTMSEESIHHLKDAEIPIEWETWWDTTLKAFNSYCQLIENKGTIVEMNKECFQELQKYDILFTQMQLSDNEAAKIKNYISKIKTYMPRFVLLLSVVDGFMDGTLPYVRIEHITNAYEICTYFINSAKSVFMQADSASEIKSVGEHLKGKTKTEIIIALVAKGFKQKDVARYVKSSPSFVSRVMKENTEPEKTAKGKPK